MSGRAGQGLGAIAAPTAMVRTAAVHRHLVIGHFRSARALLLVTTLAFVGGVPPGCASLGARGDSVPMRVETNVADATVWIDDRLIGSAMTLSKPGTRLRVGFHRVEIRHPTHYSFFAEIEPKPGDDLVIRADLHELIQ